MINPEELAYNPGGKKRLRLPRIGRPNKRMNVILGVIGALLLAGGGFFAYQQVKKPAPPEAAVESPVPKDVLGLVEKVKTKANLPSNETPTVATVTDVAKLQDQAFFTDAHMGDKVLIYSVARVAVLYRPSTNQIINQSAVEIENEKDPTASESATASSSAEPALRIKF